MKRFLVIAIAACAMATMILTPAMTFGAVIVDDSWVDAGRNNGADALDADWWSSNDTNANSVEVSVGSLGLVTGTSGRGIHATFAPQTLGIGDTITATFTFTTPATVGTAKSTSFKVAMMDFNNAGLAADLFSSSSTPPGPNPLYVGQPGYSAEFDVNSGVTTDISMREHDVASGLGRFLGTTSEWLTLDGSSPDAAYTFAANTNYVGVFSVTRTGADSADIFASMSQGLTLMDSWTVSDISGIANNFGMFGIWVNSGVFGSSSVAGEADNGIDLTNFKIEVVPEPSALALVMFGVVGLTLAKFRRRR